MAVQGYQQMEQGQADAGQDQATPGQEGGSEGGIGEMISQLYDGLNVLAKVIGEAQGVDPALKQQMGAVLKGFESVASGLSGAAQPQPQQGAVASPEQGGSSAMPAGPQTR